MAASKYFRVSVKIWNEDWTQDQRYLVFYLLTTPHRTTEGLFRLPKAYVQADLRWSSKRLEAAWSLLKDSFFYYDDAAEVILLLKALKYQAPQNPNQVRAALTALEAVPETDLDSLFGALARQSAERLFEQLPERFTHALALPPTPPPTPPSSTPQPPTRGGRRADGTNPRAQDAAKERERILSLMDECAECGSNPNVLCGNCTNLNRKLAEVGA